MGKRKVFLSHVHHLHERCANCFHAYHKKRNGASLSLLCHEKQYLKQKQVSHLEKANCRPNRKRARTLTNAPNGLAAFIYASSFYLEACRLTHVGPLQLPCKPYMWNIVERWLRELHESAVSPWTLIICSDSFCPEVPLLVDSQFPTFCVNPRPTLARNPNGPHLRSASPWRARHTPSARQRCGAQPGCHRCPLRSGGCSPRRHPGGQALACACGI